MFRPGDKVFAKVFPGEIEYEGVVCTYEEASTYYPGTVLHKNNKIYVITELIGKPKAHSWDPGQLRFNPSLHCAVCDEEIRIVDYLCESCRMAS